jgi:hypothetical protein
MENKIKPITFEEVYDDKYHGIPDEIISAVNDLIKKNFKLNDTSATVYQKDILRNITIDRERVFKNGWLDIEPLYRESGWDVSYYQPAYCESFEPYFVFSKK